MLPLPLLLLAIPFLCQGATFAPAADTRYLHYERGGGLPYYASVFRASSFPGEISIPAPDGVETTSEAMTVLVEAFLVPEPQAGAPRPLPDAHFEENPLMPFDPPTGALPRPCFTTRTLFPAGAPYPLRAQVILPHNLPSQPAYISGNIHAENYVRIRWTILDKDGRAIDNGFVSDAISTINQVPDSKEATIAARASGPVESNSLRFPATPDSARSWPFLSHYIGAVECDAEGKPVLLDAPCASNFAGRARLLGIAATNTPPAAQGLLASAPLPILPFCGGHQNRHYYRHDTSSLGNTPPGTENRFVTAEEEKLRGQTESLMGAARIPGRTLGRNYGNFYAATILFLSAFLVGTAILLVRFFVSRKGEARLRVWVALPAWCVAATVTILAAGELVLDRSPRADITQWRFSTPGEPESFVLETGRASSFCRSATSWRYPADGWFSAGDYDAGRSATFDMGAGSMTLEGANRAGGTLENVLAMRFVPATPAPFSITADDGESPLATILGDWAANSVFPPKALPKRTVTAHGDFDGVWLFARGKWYSLGSMKNGEERAPDASMFVSRGLDNYRKPFTSLFKEAPFFMNTKHITDAAEKWLARSATTPLTSAPTTPLTSDGGAVRPQRGSGAAEAPASPPQAAPAAAIIVALRSAKNPPVELAPIFATRRKPSITTRVVEVLALP